MLLTKANTIFSNCESCTDKSCAVQTLSDSELELLSNSYHEASFEKGEIILSEGSMASHIVYLRNGLVKEYGKGTSSQEYILQVVKPHSYLGLHSIFSDRINHYSYMALTKLTVCYIELPVFSKFIKENGKFSFEILSSVCNDSLRNYHRFIDQHQKKIFGKVADALLYFSSVIFQSSSFVLPLSRKEIAHMIGTSRESVSKQICGFETDNILKVHGRNITILDMERLQQISKNG
ncbi:MAG: Crp/Fnr family transcriptional regulator [Labilibaculum sp.]|nr:Crp/Fnr family transcriptional regulator [Labilibaculum sp.]MBI9058536.1 Crp/Fnr family transcriptional regulator [Labilibaculum sp.]